MNYFMQQRLIDDHIRHLRNERERDRLARGTLGSHPRESRPWGAATVRTRHPIVFGWRNLLERIRGGVARRLEPRRKSCLDC